VTLVGGFSWYTEESKLDATFCMIIKKHFLILILLSLIVFLVTSSYVRFIDGKNYLVEYEGSCDPLKSTCFAACEDDSCGNLYYYTQVTKQAKDLYRECGSDITDCDSASFCLDSDKHCSVIFCDPATAGETSTCDSIENLEPSV